MSDAVFVNFHTHTAFSDGEQTPEVLARNLAAAGVHYAALADHDSVEGLARFRRALESHDIPTLPGIELTTQLDERLVHLLAYGFDPEYPELVATLASMRQKRIPDVHSITGSLRAASGHGPGNAGDEAPPSAAPDGRALSGVGGHVATAPVRPARPRDRARGRSG